jgi:hypothetical protein
MQTCPECGKQTEGINHNERGLRCTNCFSLLPAHAEDSTVQKPPRPEYSVSAVKEARPKGKV